MNVVEAHFNASAMFSQQCIYSTAIENVTVVQKYHPQNLYYGKRAS